MGVSLETIKKVFLELEYPREVCTFSLLEKLKKDAKRNNINEEYRYALSTAINLMGKKLLKNEKSFMTYEMLGQFLSDKKLVRAFNFPFACLILCIDFWKEDEELHNALVKIRPFW